MKQLDLFPDMTREKPKQKKELTCSQCIHFPLNGRSEIFCNLAGYRVTANDCCIHHKKRRKKRTSSIVSNQKVLPRNQWLKCEAGCGRWLKTKASIAAGIGHGCKRKQEKEEK